jgi:hypothetical protein
MRLVSHAKGDPASLVEVCSIPVALVHTTAAPTLIVIVAGLNAKPLAIEPTILTLAWDPLGVGVLVEAAVGVAVAIAVVAVAVGTALLDPPPQPATTRPNSSSPVVNKLIRRVGWMTSARITLPLSVSDSLDGIGSAQIGSLLFSSTVQVTRSAR